MHAEYMQLALTLAEKATRDGEPPFRKDHAGPAVLDRADQRLGRERLQGVDRDGVD